MWEGSKTEREIDGDALVCMVARQYVHYVFIKTQTDIKRRERARKDKNKEENKINIVSLCRSIFSSFLEDE